MGNKILTPKNSPDHDVVGHHFRGMGIVYLCDSYDPTMGYWMTPIDGQASEDAFGIPAHRKNISERAIGRTYHEVWIHPDGQWKRIPVYDD